MRAYVVLTGVAICLAFAAFAAGIVGLISTVFAALAIIAGFAAFISYRKRAKMTPDPERGEPKP